MSVNVHEMLSAENMKMDDLMKLIFPEDNERPPLSPLPDLGISFRNYISTLVFMDLETTGLPFDVGRKNVHITELSLVAIDRKSFETDSTCRTMNKLSLCIRPRARISFGATDVTGLYDDMLENQSQFDKTIPPLIKNFFQRLRSPICLLAHNGKKFDFPVLQAELKRIKCHLDREILCADTLEAFRDIINSPSYQNKLNNTSIATVTNVTPIVTPEKPLMVDRSIQTVSDSVKTDISDEEIERMLSTDLDCFRNIDMFDCINQSDNETTPARTLNSVIKTDYSAAAPHIKRKFRYVSVEPKDSMAVKRKLQFPIDETPVKIKKEIDQSEDTLRFNSQNGATSSNGYENNTTSTGYQNRATSSNGYLNHSNTSTGYQNHTAASSNDKTLNGFANTKKKFSFTLENLYEHFFNEMPPQSHHAEADCITLSRICQKVNVQFLQWLDEHSGSFRETVPMW